MIETENNFRSKTHIPVLSNEVVSFLNIKPNGTYIDGTCGLGGHSKIVLERLSSKGQLISLDIDQKAINIFKKNVNGYKATHYIEKNSYTNLYSVLEKLNIKKVDGILLDLGLSSLQLESKNRGFSFLKDADLDMRFDQSSKIKASDIINQSTENEIANIIYEFGEERKSRIIAKKIQDAKPIKDVFSLVKAIKKGSPPHKRRKTFARVFQAFRISVNNELGKISAFLSNYLQILEKGGRIVIISFHSLEDRLVKRSFKKDNYDGLIKILTKKPVVPSKKEIDLNSKSRSAKMRCAEKLV